MQRRIVFLLLTIAVYLAFLTQNYFWDGVMFSLQIESVWKHTQTFAVLFHANHLLYSVFGWALYAAARLSGSAARAISLLQLANTLISAAIAWRVWTWTERATRAKDVALLAAALLACGATWWKFSTDADPYLVSVGLLLFAVLLSAEPHARWTAVAACHIGAMLFHQLAVFGYLPILVAFWNARHHDDPPPWPRIARYLALTVSVTLASYFAAYRLGAYATHPTLLQWVANYAGDTDLTHSVRQAFAVNLASYGKLFAGGKWHGTPAWVPVAAASTLLCALFLLRRPEPRSATLLPPRLQWVFAAWLLPYVLFLAWFDPGNAGHKLFLWPPLALLLATSPWSQRHANALTVAVAALALWNFGAFIYPHSRPEGEPLLAFAQRLDRQLPPDATVFYATFVPDDWYLDYFAPGRTWLPLTQLPAARGRSPVCFETTALEHLRSSLPLDSRREWVLRDKQHQASVACRQ